MQLRYSIFGESHGPAIGVVIENLPSGIPVDIEFINSELDRRRAKKGGLSTPRLESDLPEIVSGVFEGFTTGTPLCIVIPNENTRSRDYDYGSARPSHADYSAHCKYHGYEDFRGGGHFSGRITAALVAAGGVLIPALEGIGISLATHIYRCAGVSDRAFGEDLAADIKALSEKSFPVLDDAGGEEMTRRILEAREAADSVGGVTETVICGVPAGVGEPWFDSVESVISHAAFSLGGVKGIEFGAGFAVADMRGSECNDPFRLKGGEVITTTNNNGGINGGITNGMPIVFRCAVKPTPSIARPQDTVNFITAENTELSIHGRHDPAIIRRICPVLDSIAALCLADMLSLRYGTDVLTKGVDDR